MATPRLLLAAAALATAGAGLPLVMMVNGAVALGIDYHWWTWPAIPVAWAPCVAGAWLATRGRGAAGGLLLCLGAAFGLWFFRAELSLLSFGPAWLIGAYTYVQAGRRAGYFDRARRAEG